MFPRSSPYQLWQSPFQTPTHPQFLTPFEHRHTLPAPPHFHGSGVYNTTTTTDLWWRPPDPPPTSPLPWQPIAPPQRINSSNNSVPSNKLTATIDYLRRQLEIIDTKLTILESKQGATPDSKSTTTKNPHSGTSNLLPQQQISNASWCHALQNSENKHTNSDAAFSKMHSLAYIEALEETSQGSTVRLNEVWRPDHHHQVAAEEDTAAPPPSMPRSIATKRDSAQIHHHRRTMVAESETNADIDSAASELPEPPGDDPPMTERKDRDDIAEEEEPAALHHAIPTEATVTSQPNFEAETAVLEVDAAANKDGEGSTDNITKRTTTTSSLLAFNCGVKGDRYGADEKEERGVLIRMGWRKEARASIVIQFSEVGHLLDHT